MRCIKCNSELMIKISRVWVEHEAGGAFILGIAYTALCGGCGFERHMVDYRALELRW